MNQDPSKQKRSSPGAPKRSSGERSETERNEGAPGESAAGQPSAPPNPEVLEKARRRRFTAEYKLRILQEVDSARESGEIGAILRREGLYSSHLITWRRQHDAGALSALQAKKRGRKAKEVHPLARKLAESEAKNRRLEKRLAEAQIIIEFQKKVADLLGIPLKGRENEEID